MRKNTSFRKIPLIKVKLEREPTDQLLNRNQGYRMLRDPVVVVLNPGVRCRIEQNPQEHEQVPDRKATRRKSLEHFEVLRVRVRLTHNLGQHHHSTVHHTSSDSKQ